MEVSHLYYFAMCAQTICTYLHGHALLLMDLEKKIYGNLNHVISHHSLLRHAATSQPTWLAMTPPPPL